MFRIILDEYPESQIGDPFIVIKRNGDNLATLNLDERKVDCQDEYMRMRLYGIIDQYIGSYNEVDED